jgi:hypothetical protein
MGKKKTAKETNRRIDEGVRGVIVVKKSSDRCSVKSEKYWDK